VAHPAAGSVATIALPRRRREVYEGVGGGPSHGRLVVQRPPGSSCPPAASVLKQLVLEVTEVELYNRFEDRVFARPK
jgi:hypothetical protein